MRSGEPDFGINLDGIFHPFHRVADAKLLNHTGMMLFRGLDADAENFGDLRGCVAFDQQTENRSIPLRLFLIAQGPVFVVILPVSVTIDHLGMNFHAEEVTALLGRPNHF